MPGKRKSNSGSALIEFTLVGIPMIFALISIVEMARGMWNYSTLAHAVKEATRYAIVHGQTFSNACNKAAGGTNLVACQLKVQDIATRVRDMGIGLNPSDVNITITTNGTVLAAETLTAALADATAADVNNVRIDQTFDISARSAFTSAIGMFWPGVRGGTRFPTIQLPASSRDYIQF